MAKDLAHPIKRGSKGEEKDSEWKIVDKRGYRGWLKLSRSVEKTVDDLYSTCELECNLAHIHDTVIFLTEALADFKQLAADVQRITVQHGATESGVRSIKSVAWELKPGKRSQSPSRLPSPRKHLEFGSPFGADAGNQQQRALALLSDVPSSSRSDSLPAGSDGVEAAATSAAAGSSHASRAHAQFERDQGRVGSEQADATASASEAQLEHMNVFPIRRPPPLRTEASAGLPDVTATTDADPPEEAPAGSPAVALSPSPSALSDCSSISLVDIRVPLHRSESPIRLQHSEPPPARLVRSTSAPAQRAAALISFDAVGTKIRYHAQPLATTSSPSGFAAWSDAVDWSRVYLRPAHLLFETDESEAATTATCSSEAGGSRSNSRCSSAGGFGSGCSGRVPAWMLHQKLMSPDRARKSPLETKRAAEERQARAEQLRIKAMEERLAKLAKAKLVQEAARTLKQSSTEERQLKYSSRHERSAQLRAKHLTSIVQKAGDETRKVHELQFITRLQTEDKKMCVQERLEQGEARRAERLAAILARQQEAQAAVEVAHKRRKLKETERQVHLADRQRRKEAAQAKLEEDRRVAALAREAHKEQHRALAEQLEAARARDAAALGSHINDRLREAAERRLQQLELIRERAALGKEADRRDSFTSPKSPGGASVRALSTPDTTRHSSTPDPPQRGTPPPTELVYSPGRRSRFTTQSVGKLVHTPCSRKNRLKGMRRRAAKLTRAVEAASFDFHEPDELVQLLDCNHAQQLQQRWSGAVAAAASAGPRQQRAEAAGQLLVDMQLELEQDSSVAPHVARRSGALKWLCDELPAALTDGGRSALATRHGGPSAAAEPASSSEAIATSAAARAPDAWHDGTASSPADGAAANVATADIGGDGPDGAQPRAQRLGLLLQLLQQPVNCDYILGTGLAAGLVKVLTKAMDHSHSLTAVTYSADGVYERCLQSTLEVLCAVLSHSPADPRMRAIQIDLIGLAAACGVVTRINEIFSLFDQPQLSPTRPVPPHILGCLRLLELLTASEGGREHVMTANKHWPHTAPQAAALVLSLQETSMAGLLSLLTAVLLQAAPSCTPAEASPQALPANFVEVAHLVMRVLNNVALLDLVALQKLLASTHNRVEFFHLISFLLSYCTNQWPEVGAAGRRTATTPPASAPAAATATTGSPAPAPRTPHNGRSRADDQQQQTLQQQQQQPPQQYQSTTHPRAQSKMPKTHGAQQQLSSSRSGSQELADSAAATAPTNVAPASERSRSPYTQHLRALAAGGRGGRPSPARRRLRGGSTSAQATATAMGMRELLHGRMGVLMQHPIAQLLNEVLLLIGYFAILSRSNQSILQWGKYPSILHRLCVVPFPYFSHPQLTAVLMPTLLCVCYNADRACETVENYVSLQLLLDFLNRQDTEADEKLLSPVSYRRVSDSMEGSSSGSPASSSRLTREPQEGEPGTPDNGGGSSTVVVVSGSSSADKSTASGVPRASYQQLLSMLQNPQQQQVPSRFSVRERFPLQLLTDAKEFFLSRLETQSWMNERV